MQAFVPGQRWVSSAELDMGLGTVIRVEHRTVTLLFPATGETRIYAHQSAPLSRVKFVPGDTVLDAGQRAIAITAVSDDAGLLTYTGTDDKGQTVQLPEGALNNYIQLNRPGERLFSGQIDAPRLFALRQESWSHRHRLLASDLFGLSGCRTSLIPHQLYIAHEVGRRYAPRVLLADEVGLGKTIEAGLILHQQLLGERASRVLIVVPDSLVHQWLVEMLRRFNLMFSVFDNARHAALSENNPDDNPFHAQQLVLCSLDFLAGNDTAAQQALNGEWDLLVVDEAHHLQWTPDAVSHEYRLVEELANRIAGVLLLTATPEQLGRAGHFARLRLLDSNRFPDLERFLAEESAYEPVARAVERLLDDEALDTAAHTALTALLPDADSAQALHVLETAERGGSAHLAAQQALVEQLLDRHGTGRVLFRNTRAAIRGFPQRRVHASPLPLPAAYAECLDALNDSEDSLALRLCPERAYRQPDASAMHWSDIDPRFNWLSQTLISLKPDKVLVIAANAETAVELAERLYSRAGVHAAVFHEGLSLVERDRAAAYFADRETGTQVLVCSEIGSEGRNFQFAHHLVLFDLPLNPDLLEQRIGRLDRIGQAHSIEIHVPYLQGSAQEVLYRWYHEGLAAFTTTCPAGPQVYAGQQRELHAALAQPGQDHHGLIQAANTAIERLNTALHRGRDRLLEYNSCRQPDADALCKQAQDLENAGILSSYMDALFDTFGISSRLHSAGCLILQPGEHMLQPVPGLPEDGMTVTFERDIALSFEDAHYLSWEHPLVRDCMDMMLSSELGNCSVTAVTESGFKPGTLLLECLYIAESSHRALKSGRHLPPMPVRILVDENGTRHDQTLSAAHIDAHSTPVNADTARQIVQAREHQLRELLHTCEQHAAISAQAAITAASEEGRHTLQNEIDRLRALAQLNPNVRDAEIVFFEQQLTLFERIVHTAGARLDALRVIVAT